MESRTRREAENRSLCRCGAPFLRRASSTHHIRDTCRATYRSCGHSSDRRTEFLFSFRRFSRKDAKDAKKGAKFFFACLAPLREKYSLTTTLSRSQLDARVLRGR